MKSTICSGLFSGIVFCVASGAIAQTSGPIAWWPGDGNANDAVGSNHGTLHNGATYAAGRIGRAFSFDGVDDFVSFGNSIGNFGTSDFTVEFWIRRPTARLEAVFGKRLVCAFSSMWDIRGVGPGNSTINARLSMEVVQDNAIRGFMSVGDITGGDFHHVAYTRQGTTLRAYRDGIKESEVITTAIADLSNTEELRAGLSPCTGSGGNFFDGTFLLTGELDEIKLYDRALSDSEIARAAATTITINIDIKPGSDPNSINLCSNGAVPVAILGSNTFDVGDVNIETLRFAEASVKVVGKKDPHSLCSVEDVDGDSIYDLVCHYVTADIAASGGESTTATVNGELFDGTPIEGTDRINIVKDTCN
jgi:hypothetical protein